MMGTERTAVATRSLPTPDTDGETDSGITWPPVEKLELVWFEKSPPPEEVVENFRIVPLNDIGGRRALADEPAAPVEPARAPESEPLESWTPATPVALVAPRVSAIERLPAIDQFRIAPPDPLVVRQSGAQWFFTGALAGCAVGLLLVMVVFWWRWPAAPVQTTQAPAAVVADSQAPPSARPADVRPPVSRSAKLSTPPAPTPTRRFAISKHGRRPPRSRQLLHVRRRRFPSRRRFLSRGTRQPIVRPRTLARLKP